MVFTESILSSYSLKPVLIGSIVKAETILFPALTAEFVILVSAVTPITSRAENFIRIDSTAPPRVDKLTFLAAALTFSSPLEAPVRFKLRFNLSSVLKLV